MVEKPKVCPYPTGVYEVAREDGFNNRPDHQLGNMVNFEVEPGIGMRNSRSRLNI